MSPLFRQATNITYGPLPSRQQIYIRSRHPMLLQAA